MLPELRIGLLHGQLPGVEKTAVMQQFASRSIDVLVTTTVIEVGVDVPNATLMVIEHAERFGLAQLHQLRGRIGRGVQQSYCILLYDEPLSETARERLKVVYETNDGFEVARRDLMMRGPGEFLGSRQSGVPLLRLADLERDAELVERARGAAEALLAHDPAAAREHARECSAPDSSGWCPSTPTGTSTAARSRMRTTIARSCSRRTGLQAPAEASWAAHFNAPPNTCNGYFIATGLAGGSGSGTRFFTAGIDCR